MLKGKVALISGGGQGIGKEIAACFAEAGADLILCDINPEILNNARAELQARGAKVEIFVCDVASSSAVAEMVNKILDKFPKIDILINNAGITRDGLLLRMKETDWDQVLAVNLKGTFNLTQSASKVMVRAHAGRIINIASIIGIIGNTGQANYAASKAGIIGFTKSVARELAPRNVTVNAIAPGFIQTAMTDKLKPEAKAAMLKNIPLGRFGQARDVANLALFLASESAGYITGQVIRVCGGMVM